MKNIITSIFRKKQKPESVFYPEPSVCDVKIKYSDEIEMIHHEFEVASELRLEEARSIINEASKKPIDKVNRMTALGFNQAKQVDETKTAIRQIELSKTDVDLIMYYKRKYPLNKFITEEQVKTICFKYGLVCGEVSRFKGFLPEKNLNEIERFRVDKKDARKSAWSIGTYSSYIGQELDDDGEQAIKWETLFKKEEREMSLRICAPLKDMDTKGMKLVDGYKLKPHIPDPVVLKAVTGGWLIVTAWGDEASDPIVVNEINN